MIGKRLASVDSDVERLWEYSVAVLVSRISSLRMRDVGKWYPIEKICWSIAEYF